jgi:D-alanine-D-alanine ligase
LLTALQIPFTGSDETTLSITLDKALCKKVLSYSSVKTPGFNLLYEKNDRISPSLKYPLIVKPNAEGSGKGIIDISVAQNEDELYRLTARILELYRQPVLVEEFIRGREFTVSVLGNGSETEVLPPMEIIYTKPQTYNIYNYNIKQNYKDYVRYDCPACISPEKESEIRDIALKVYKELECRDLARIDFILDQRTGEVYFLEINPLPGLTPSYSDFPMTAEFAGISYDELIIRIINNALKRYEMKTI